MLFSRLTPMLHEGVVPLTDEGPDGYPSGPHHYLLRSAGVRVT